jgi:arsenate reductase
MSSKDFPVTIYHNPACGTSRNVVAMAEAAGHTPNVIEYLKTGWTAELLGDLSKRTGLSLRQLMREKGSPAQDLGLLEDGVAEDAILAAMLAHPILVNRPIVVTPKGAALCRPSDTAAKLL